jgi:hypothetical protein
MCESLRNRLARRALVTFWRVKTRKSTGVDKFLGAGWGSFANVLCGAPRALTMGQVIGLGMDSALTVKSAVRVTV